MDFIYRRLSQIPVIKHNYSLKFLFVAFIGIHVPLIGIITYALTNSSNYFSAKIVIITALLFTLLSTAVTLYFLNKLLAPLLMSDKALKDYINTGALPNLPKTYGDEAGKLMALIQETIQHLDKLANDKQEITTLVSHNLRTPLNQIVGFCELIKIDADNLKEYVEKIESVTKLQLRSLSDLLNQLMATGTTLNTSNALEYNLNVFIEDEIEGVMDSIKAKDLKLTLHLTDELLTTNKSKNNLSLVFQNLISNAIKFSYRYGEISVATRRLGDHIEIEVRDEGLGFSASYQPSLFKDARTTGRKGTNNEPSVGLGLHLSKKIIEQSGGGLTAFSDGDGKGARFIIAI